MVYGYFPEGMNIPYVEVSIFSSKNSLRADFVLDTGFSGDLKIDEQTADKLGIVASEDGHIINARGEKIHVGRARGYAEMEGRKMLVEIFIVNGPLLAGIGLFSMFDYKAVVDCKNRTAHLEHVI